MKAYLLKYRVLTLDALELEIHNVFSSVTSSD